MVVLEVCEGNVDEVDRVMEMRVVVAYASAGAQMANGMAGRIDRTTEGKKSLIVISLMARYLSRSVLDFATKAKPMRCGLALLLLA